jgi:hypothetical protein
MEVFKTLDELVDNIIGPILDEAEEVYSIPELKVELEKEKQLDGHFENGRFEPFLKVDGVFNHLYAGSELIQSERFRDHPDIPDVKVSNMGRVMYKGEILPQEKESADKYDYLGVYIPQWKLVYQLVAETFYGKNLDKTKNWIVHFKQWF